jgi:lipopolysaccharide/colanic/teichoic acid biosynthesis glycosyltransferase
MKRFFDLLASGLGLLVLFPFFLVIAGVIEVSSPGGAFYRSQRAGKDGKLFRLYKFRTMVANADRVGPKVTGSQDSRVTPIGRWLRKYKVDELPQLINVFIGEMSLVGPRPEDPKYIAHYTADQRRVLSVKPGITGAASLRYRHEEALLTGENWEQKYLTTVMPDKLQIELEYLERQSFLNDMLVLWQTLIAIFR